MRAPRTLVAYLLREVVLYTLLGLAAIIVVLVTQNLLRALDDLVAAGLRGRDLLLVIRLLGTMLVVYALPISFLFGVLLAIGRMSADIEILAMRTCGIGLRTVALPVILLGLLISATTLRFTLEAEPAARREMHDAIKTMLARGGVIEPGRFRSFGAGRLFYVQDRDENQLRDILISDRTDRDHPFLVFAKSATIRLDEDRGELIVTLRSGDIHLRPDDEKDRYQRIAFDRFEYGVDVASIVGKGKARRAREMTMAELEESMQRAASGDMSGLVEEPIVYALHWNRRIAEPLAPTLFGLVGVPIAMRRTRGARSLGVLWCAGLASTYYFVQRFSEFFATQGWFPAFVAPWIPNVIFALAGIVLLARARRAGV